MATYAQASDDVLIAMGFTTDDALRHRAQVMYNVKLVRDKLAKQVLGKRMKSGDFLGASNMVATYIVPVVHNDVSDNVVTDFDASYFDLPSAVLSLDNGAGINAVRYLRNEIPMGCPPAFARNPFTPTTLAGVNSIYDSTYRKPSVKQPYYAQARAGSKDRVYLFGVNEYVKNLLVSIYATVDFTDIDPDEEINLPDELLHTLKQMVLGMEAWALQIPQERLKSDGRDFEPNQIVRTSPPISINHPAQLDE